MPWAAGVFTRFYAGTGNWDGDRIAGTLITASRHDAHDGDLATGINNCMAKDGTNAATANLSMGGFNLTNLPNPPGGTTHAASKAYVDSLSTLPFISGDQIIFRNAGGTAPTGWAIVAAQNDVALRIIGSGTPGSFAGTGFTTVFSSARTTAAGSSHTHGAGTIAVASHVTAQGSGALGSNGYFWFNGASADDHSVSGSTAAESAHTHTSNLAVSYYEMFVIQKT